MNFLGKSGGSLSSHPTLFSPCSRFLFVPVGSNVKVFDAESGSLVRVLSSAARGEISQLALASESLLLAFSVDGCIAVWDWQAASTVRILRTKLPMHSAVIKVDGDCVTAFVVSHRLKGVASGCTLPDPKRLFNYCAPRMISLIYRISFSLSGSGFKMTQLFKSRGLCRLALSPCGDELAFSSKAQVKLWRLDEQDLSRVRTLQHSNNISRLLYHPTEPCLVLADVLGRIVMWYCLSEQAMTVDDQVQNMPQRTLHWHANEVTDLAFSNEGQYLLSGGEESVMVLWQIESGLRQYLPRLGDPIHFISVSPDDRIAAVSTRNNCIHLVSLTQGSSLQVQSSIHGVSKTGRSLTGSIPRIGKDKPLLLLPGTPGKVQLFDPLKDAIRGGVEVAPQNRKSTFLATAADKHRPLEVALTSVSSCGRWMVTLEQRRGKDTKASVLTARLKFWSLSQETDELATLLTVVDRPHRDLITDLSIWVGLNGMPMAASSSLDGTFKIWGIDAKHGIWSCQHVGSYHEVGLGCLSVSVSPDASLLATSFGPSVTLWSLESGSFGHLLDVLTPSQACLLKEARFVGNDGILVSCRESGIFSFTRSPASQNHFQLLWHAPVISRAPIFVHPELAQFALICTNPHDEELRTTCVLSYGIDSPLPVGYHFALTSKAADFVAGSYVLAPEAVRSIRGGDAEKYLLAVLDVEGEFTLLGSESASRVCRKDFLNRIKPARVERVEASKTKTKALYEAIFNNEGPGEAVKEITKHSMAELFTAVSQVPKEEVLLPLVASHVLPPMNMLFAHFIKNTVKKL